MKNEEGEAKARNGLKLFVHNILCDVYLYMDNWDEKCHGSIHSISPFLYVFNCHGCLIVYKNWSLLVTDCMISLSPESCMGQQLMHVSESLHVYQFFTVCAL